MGLLVLLTGMLTLSACAAPQQASRRSSAAIDSRRSSAFDGGVTRLLVMLGRSEHPNEDQLFRTFIERELAKRRVAAVVATVSEATLDEPLPPQAAELAAERRAVRVLAPEALLRIRSTSVIPDANRPQSRITMIYEIALHLVSPAGMGERVWRAELEHSGSERNMEKRFMLAAECLMQRLDADGILSPNPDVQ